MFDCEHCELELDPGKRVRFLRMLDDAFGAQMEVVAVLEMGSFAKAEAVPASDIDTRVYVRGSSELPMNVLHKGDVQVGLEAFQQQADAPRVQKYDWWTFNEPSYRRISDELGRSISFGFIDTRYASFLFNRLDAYPTPEHSMLFQSNVLYDPREFVEGWRTRLEKRVFPSLVKLYEDQARRRANRRLGQHLGPAPYDDLKLQDSGQVQWVAQAVRCVREAVGARTYAENGCFTFRRPEVLAYVRKHFPGTAELVEILYAWKCDPNERETIRREFVTGSSSVYARFQELTPRVQAVVECILGDSH